MKQPEVISIAHTGHLAKQASSTPESRLDTDCLGNASKVGSVDANGKKTCRRKNDRGDNGSRVSIVRPVRRVERICPFRRPLVFVIALVCF